MPEKYGIEKTRSLNELSFDKLYDVECARL